MHPVRAPRASGSCCNRPWAVGLRRTPSDARSRPDWIRSRPADIIDLFVYVVVLNLAIEYPIGHQLHLSLLTAALLKIALELVIRLKNRILTGPAPRPRGAASSWRPWLWAVAAGSKLVVLELVDLTFGDPVRLGGLIPATLLVLALLGARAVFRRLFSPSGSADG